MQYGDEDDLIDIWKSPPSGDIFAKLLDFCIPGKHFSYIFDVDLDKYEWVSDNVANVVGFEKENMDDLQIFGNIHPQDKEIVFEINNKLDALVYEHGRDWVSQFTIMYDYRFLHRDGHYIRTLKQLVQFFDPQSNRYKHYGIITDITHLKKEGAVSFSLLHLYGGNSFIDMPLTVSESKMHPFSKREEEIVSLILRGMSNKEIADKLFISPETVKNHKKNIFAKAGCNSSTQLFKLCISSGWKNLFIDQAVG